MEKGNNKLTDITKSLESQTGVDTHKFVEMTEPDLVEVTEQNDVQAVKELLDQHSESPVEEKELSDEEKKEIYIEQLKKSRMTFNPITHMGKETVNKFGDGYKKHRKRRNSLAKKTRSNNNRKK